MWYCFMYKTTPATSELYYNVHCYFIYTTYGTNGDKECFLPCIYSQFLHIHCSLLIPCSIIKESSMCPTVHALVTQLKQAPVYRFTDYPYFGYDKEKMKQPADLRPSMWIFPVQLKYINNSIWSTKTHFPVPIKIMSWLQHKGVWASHNLLQSFVQANLPNPCNIFNP